MFSVLGINPAKGSTKLVYMDAIGSDPTQPRKIPDPYSLHTGFNPSTSGFFQQHLEDCETALLTAHSKHIRVLNYNKYNAYFFNFSKGVNVLVSEIDENLYGLTATAAAWFEL